MCKNEMIVLYGIRTTYLNGIDWKERKRKENINKNLFLMCA